MTPHKCPICLGCGNVPGGFYQCTIGHIQQWSSANAIEACRQCKGTGIIWANESNLSEVRE
jgi:hypothetical protein